MTEKTTISKFDILENRIDIRESHLRKEIRELKKQLSYTQNFSLIYTTVIGTIAILLAIFY